MAISTTEQFKLKKFVKELELYRGRHTELVTVYIPQGYDINKIMNHLRQEQDTASNIKSTSTRKNVVDALERMIQHLKIYKKHLKMDWLFSPEMFQEKKGNRMLKFGL